jgi:PKD repeat protein
VKLTASNSGGYDIEPKSNYITVSATSIALKAGWNFVSTPKKLLAGYDTGDIFSEVDRAGHSIWLYDGYQKLWVRMDSTTPVRPLDGIWIFARAPVEVPLVYDTNPIQLPPTKMLAQGWNTVGFTGLTAATARDTLLSVVNNWTQVMGFDADAQQYDVSIINKGSGEHSDTRLMFPTKGYWIYMSSPGEVTAIGV